MRAVIQIDRWMGTICRVGLVCCVFLMMSFALFGIVLRWRGTGWPWIDPLVQHLVFLSTFLGGAVATEKDSHISIDLGGRYLETKKKWGAYLFYKKFISFICFLGLIWLIVVSWQLTSLEWEYGRVRFLGIHSGILISLIPMGFMLIALRFLIQLFLPIRPLYSRGNF